MSPNARGSDVQAQVDCVAAARWLWDYVDARLPDASRTALERHLAVCARCAKHVGFARAMRRALAELRGNYRGGIALPLSSPPAHSRASHDPRLE
jgi:anti-sigma factor RsiW